MSRVPSRASMLMLIGALSIAWGCSSRDASREIGQPAPRYAGVTLDGGTFELAQHLGEVVLLNVWATWCQPCRQELPELARLEQEHAAQGLSVVAVSVDAADQEPAVRRLVDGLKLPFTVVLDPRGHVTSRFRVQVFPTSVLIGRDGIVRWRRAGVIRPRDGDLKVTLQRALAANSPPPAAQTPGKP